jgi:hypothetical protein
MDVDHHEAVVVLGVGNGFVKGGIAGDDYPREGTLLVNVLSNS